MCGYCCGGTPVEKRGEGHKNCSIECYNAPRRKARKSTPTPTAATDESASAGTGGQG